MMRKIKSLVSIFLTLILLTSCASLDFNVNVNNQPHIPNPHLGQYYKLQKSYDINLGNEEFKMPYSAYITKDKVLIDNNEILNPRFKAIRVKTYDYFLTRYKVNPISLGINNQFVDVYTTINDEGKTFRLIKINDDLIINDVGRYLDFMVKAQSSEVRKEVVNYSSNTPLNYEANGVLLSMKYAGKNGENGQYRPSYYETYWIAMDDKKELTIYRINDILLPRKDFFILKTDTQENSKSHVETISLTELQNKTKTVKQITPTLGKSRYIDISFISDKYISFTEKISDTKEVSRNAQYRTYPLDNIDSTSPLSIEDLFGLQGKDSMESASRDKIKDVQNLGSDLLKGIEYDSFILKRKKGKWVFEGKINASDEYSPAILTYQFNINSLNKMYNYNTLQPSFDIIYKVNPNAEDAVSSPGRFFTVVKEKDKIKIYKKDSNNVLPLEPLKVITLPEDGDIIMNEWALSASYVKEWNSIISNVGVQIK